jgi:hypothetical protein
MNFLLWMKGSWKMKLIKKLCNPLLVCALLLGSMQAQTAPEKRWIERLKSTSVSEIDSTLAAEPFDNWLKKLVTPEEPAYEVTDCGERSYTPEERGRQFPLCVNVTAKFGALRRAELTFIVGNYVAQRDSKHKPQAQPTAKIELFYGEVGPSDPRSKQLTRKVSRLSDLLQYADGK